MAPINSLFVLALAALTASAHAAPQKKKAPPAPAAAEKNIPNAPPAAPLGKVWTVDHSSKITFLAVGKPSFLKIRGEGASSSGEMAEKGKIANGSVTVNLNEFTTGIAMRDKHMKEKYLQTGEGNNNGATIKFEGVPTSCFEDGKKCPLTGTLTLHGKTNPLNGVEFTSSRSGDTLKVHSEFPVDLVSHGIDVPSYSGITVAKEVTVTADLILK